VKRYIIEKYKDYPTVKIYTVRFKHEKQNETDRFISRFIANDEYKDDFNIIIYWIRKIGSSGSLERYFRPEKKAKAIPLESGYSLRLYCYRINDETLILGNGGVKTSNKVQNSPDCFPHFELMNHVAKKVYWGLNDGRLKLEKGQLSGELEFNYRTAS